MRLPGAVSRGALLLWFGVLGPPLAWIAQHVTGIALSQAACREAGVHGWDVHMDAWTIAVSATAAALAAAGEVAAVAAWRATRDAGYRGAPPRGRINFLAVIGVVTGPLFLAMIVMSGLGAIFLVQCVQS